MKKVRVSLGRTIQLKQYESLRVDVSVENEADDYDKLEPQRLFRDTLIEVQASLAHAVEEAKRDCA